MNRYSYKKLSVILMSIAVLGSALTGCGTSSKVSAGPSSTNTASVSSKQLVFYSAQGYDDAMAKAFQAKTGIKVNLVDMSTGPLAAKIEAEKSNSHWDVAWFDGDATMQALDNEGLLMQGWAPKDASNLTQLGQSLVPADKAYYPTGVTAAAAIGVNSKLLPRSEYPKDWNDLLKPTFKNALAMNNPSVSGPTFPYVAGILNLMGDAQGKQFFASLKDNGMKVGETNDVEIKSLLNGQVKAVTIQDSALVAAKADGNPIDIIYPSSGVFTLPGVIAVNKNAPNAEAAKQFVEFVLSPEGQKVMLDPKNGGGDSYFNPIITGVEGSSVRQSDGINWLKVDPVKSAQDENDIKKWFNDAIIH
ncbi:ABC-type Fe3+ transport system, periplasmic component [Desulfosporosinus acidiphilus SJ4]|uniref:ABC-type Fe3+ transport system, periplasmic component n=1 Tax=Desulfosporosinus acidiphilus (strain DSM 22704 / JCM 16185 / SJ4) TaxID=646529 RepID=I4DB58_DESAJ|nr:extracellular solute-binding protein [Desulfosporosinus acidiphilus]AFM43032.1 ABC-type Fe3+ transport system, periplasmic component [Desulfosporosinus acidiphilus SJ4]